jgi:hypothetical protein
MQYAWADPSHRYVVDIYLDTTVLLPENAPMVSVTSKLTRLRVVPINRQRTWQLPRVESIRIHEYNVQEHGQDSSSKVVLSTNWLLLVEVRAVA